MNCDGAITPAGRADAAGLREGRGFRPRSHQTVHTAGGDSLAARVRLDTVTISGVRLKDVDALVIGRGLPASLLGMSYLGRLSQFEATPTALVLHP